MVQSGVDGSLLGRIENTKTRRAVQALAKFFSVSTDFLLGLTDIPDRKNNNISELGLSIQAGRNLYTGAVKVQVVNLLLEDPQFSVLGNYKGGEASQLMQVSEEEFAERFRQNLAYLPEISDRISDELLSAFINIARIAAQKDVKAGCP